ncbi:hypothetical protein ES703_125442 [subsurface metagenome]
MAADELRVGIAQVQYQPVLAPLVEGHVGVGLSSQSHISDILPEDILIQGVVGELVVEGLGELLQPVAVEHRVAAEA